MKRKKSKLVQKIGVPSESVVFIGDKKVEHPIVTVSDIIDGKYSETRVKDYKKFSFNNDKAELRWIDVYGVHDTELIEKIGNDHNIHNLILADIANTEHNPKVQFFEDYLFIEFRILTYDNTNYETHSEQLSLILGKNFVVSFQESESNIFEFIRKRLQGNHDKSKRFTADYLFYALADAVVDKYYEVLELLSEDIELVEDNLIENPNPALIETVHKLKRALIFIRKSTWPLREIIKRIEITKSHLIDETNDLYFRDVYEHVIQIIDTIEMQREIIAELLDIYLSSVSFKLNEVMKVLTIISTIFIPLTFISSIYGMNFHFMPELRWYYGYPMIISIMLILGVTMLAIFKKKKWF